MAKKKNNDIRISFVDSMSAKDVTGSCTYVETSNHKILVDCGLYQSDNLIDDFKINKRHFKGFKPKEIDTVFCTHLHLDHIGLIPRLYMEGYGGSIIMAKNNCEVSIPMLRDSAYITERDATLINKQRGTNYKPIYTIEEANVATAHIMEYPYREKIKIDDELSFELYDAGHLLGSAQIKLYITVNNITKTILFTGDIGNNCVGNRFVGQLDKVVTADIVIGEATYGERTTLKTTIKERTNDLEKMTTIIENVVIQSKGRVLIPVFAQCRSQQLLLMLYRIFKNRIDTPEFYLDSPLAVEICKTYEHILDEQDQKDLREAIKWEHIHLIEKPEDSMVLVSEKKMGVYLSSSGFMNAGRVRKYLKNIIDDPNACILFCGYSSPSSLAGIIKNPKTRTITIDQKSYKVKCSIYSLKSLSGHAPFNQLIDYYSNINCNKIILNHGSELAKQTLADQLKKELEQKCNTARVIIANNSLKLSI
jgi:metallo-beta-lactamase family protein